MDARQQELSNPFGMDEDCRNCPALCESRSRVVHGYGDVGADFLFVGESPGPGADRAGVPSADDPDGRRVLSILRRLGLCSSSPDEGPGLENAFLTYLTRCRHPGRPPTEEEVSNCDPFLTAEIRMINPEILVPVGERALSEIAREHTTTPAAELDAAEHHAERVRGRGFEIVPMLDPGRMDDDDADAFVEAFGALMSGDYRQTKGRRER